LSGGAASDFINSASALDTVLGRDGNDVIHALAGASKVFGGTGNDLLDVPGGGSIWGNAGNDQITTLLGNSSIYPGAGIDSVRAGVGNDEVVIFDLCEVGFGEVLDGGFGDDTLRTSVSLATLLSRGVNRARLRAHRDRHQPQLLGRVPVSARGAAPSQFT